MNSSNHTVKAILLATFCLFAASTLHADRVARILYYGASAEAPKNAVVYQARTGPKSTAVGEPQGIQLPRHNFTKSFDLDGGKLRLSFLPSRLAEEVPVPEEAPSVMIPKNWEKVLLLVFADPSNPVMPIRVKALNASDDVFGPGELLFINYSEISIFGLLGEQKLLVHPGTMKVVSSPMSKMGEYQVKLDSVEGDIESRRWLMRQTWRHHPGVRRVVFAFPLPAPRTVKLYSAPIRDF
ncbi:hypothetical protein ACWPKO_11035 [Coraliomargarita sp. W4R53]